jgi:hypothetical protein
VGILLLRSKACTALHCVCDTSTKYVDGWRRTVRVGLGWFGLVWFGLVWFPRSHLTCCLRARVACINKLTHSLWVAGRTSHHQNLVSHTLSLASPATFFLIARKRASAQTKGQRAESWSAGQSVRAAVGASQIADCLSGWLGWLSGSVQCTSLHRPRCCQPLHSHTTLRVLAELRLILVRRPQVVSAPETPLAIATDCLRRFDSLENQLIKRPGCFLKKKNQLSNHVL